MQFAVSESFDSEIHLQRRNKIAGWLQQHGGGVAIVPTAPEVTRNRDNTYPYRADSYFYYLTGFTEPDAWLIVDDTGYSTLFCNEKDPLKEVWTGYRLGPDAAPEFLAVDSAYPVDEIDEHMVDILANQPAVWYPFATHAGLETQVDEWLSALRGRARSGILSPHQLCDLCLPLDEMRLIKDEHEINLLRRAGKISAQGHAKAMQRCKQAIDSRFDLREYHLEAELLYTFCQQGAQDVSFNSIVAAGANACVLHYRAGHAPIHAGDLVLIDAGCEYEYYSGDISRTFPASGQFSSAQRDLYELVLQAQHAAHAQVKPNITIAEVHLAAVKVLAQGMLDLGLLDSNKVGNLSDVIASKAYARFYMHNTSHWLGLDVHDCGGYVEAKLLPRPSTQKGALPPPSKRLQPNMVLTLEPGIYVQASSDVPEKFHHIGIRIEDDALVTDTGSELLTRDVPVDPLEIEYLMSNA